MYRGLSLACVALLAGWLGPGAAAQDAPPNPKVVIETTEGDITIELFRADAPASVVNFLMYVRDGYYDGTIFHRVIRNFMIQAGGYTAELTLKTEGLRGAILNEATNNLRNQRGTIAMARTAEPNSAHAQFFINTEDNRALDHKNRTAQGFGYAVFGEVTDGMDIVDRIERARTHGVNGMDDVPRAPIVIKQIRRLDQ
jgi:cyclophilin family peptidyl-prolyl cis-trans isomerase